MSNRIPDLWLHGGCGVLQVFAQQITMIARQIMNQESCADRHPKKRATSLPLLTITSSVQVHSRFVTLPVRPGVGWMTIY
jgi:hypothetical protein